MDSMLEMNNSTTSSTQLEAYKNNSHRIREDIRELLKSRIFLGRYMERRLIDEYIGYRDVILVSAAEVELNRDLAEVIQKIKTCYPSIQWVGITDSENLNYHPPGMCIWTEIDNQPFGAFWFQVRNVKFRENEVIMILKCVRHISDAFIELEPILTMGPKKSQKIVEKDGNVEVLSETMGKTYKDIVETLKTALTISNVKEFFTFLFAFIIAVFTGGIAFINFLGNFILALIRECSILIKNSTPMFLGFLDFMSKIIGGFYILIAMFFKSSTNVPSKQRTISYPSSYPIPSRGYNRNYIPE